MKKNIILMLLVLYTSASAQKSKEITTIRELTDSIQVIMKQRQIPGLMLGIVTRDSVLFSGGLGYADIASKRLVTDQTMFRLGSITKSFVAIAIMQLARQGKLNLNDALKQIAPEVPFENAWESTHPVRIVDLLEHTTGFDDFKLNRMYALKRKNYTTRAMMLLQKNSMVCRWKPSDRYSYSNVNYAILGYIISKLTGKEYDQYLRENILSPTGMKHSHFKLYSTNASQDVREYTLSSKELIQVPSVSFLIGPAGALWSNAADMSKFVQLFLRHDSSVIPNALRNDMETSHSSLAARAGLKGGYGYGNEDLDGFRGHTGLLGVCRSSFRYNRDLGVGFVISSNGNGLAGIEELITSYLTRHQSRKSIETIALDHKAINPYLGYYQIENPRHEILGFTDRLLLLKVEIVDDTLCLNILGKKRKIVPSGPLTFASPGAGKASIVFFTNGTETSVVINDRYCEKTPVFSALLKRLALLLSALLTIGSVIPAITGILRAFKHDYQTKELVMLCLPAVCAAFLGLGLFSFGKVFTQSYLLYKLNGVNLISFGIFSGTLLFAILSVINLAYLTRNLQHLQSRLLSCYMLFTAISLITLALFLFVNGWVGLRTWAM